MHQLSFMLMVFPELVVQAVQLNLVEILQVVQQRKLLAQAVAATSSEITGVLQICPPGMVPFQRARNGTRMPPSRVLPLPPRNGPALPPSAPET